MQNCNWKLSHSSVHVSLLNQNLLLESPLPSLLPLSISGSQLVLRFALALLAGVIQVFSCWFVHGMDLWRMLISQLRNWVGL